MTGSERRLLEQSLDALQDVFFTFTVDGEPIRWNHRLSEAAGYSDEEIAGMAPIDFFPPEERDRVADAIGEVAETGSARLRTEVLTKGGERVPYEFVGARLTDEAGDVVGFTGIGRDVSEQEERRARLERQANRLAAYSVAFPDLAFIVDRDGRNLDVLAGASSQALLAAEPDDVVGSRAHDVLPEQLADDWVESIRRALDSGDPQELEYALEVDAGERWFEARVEPLPFEVDGAEVAITVVRDVTERKERERELQRQNVRLERFASVVSHDLRNPLNLAQGRLELAREDVDGRHVEPIERALDRMERIIDDVLWLAREGRDIGETSAVDLEAAAGSAWEMVAQEAAGATLEMADTDGRGAVEADRDRLLQLLENLFRNALEHGGEGVTVAVGTVDDGFFVEDDGPGIPEEDRDRVFEAGYSTAQDGTGFGLSIVEEIAEAHGWEVDVAEGTGGGARFEFRGGRAD